jgi:integrase/recombinase XerD
MTDLRQALADYLLIRSRLGFKLKNARWLLPKFVAYLEQQGATTVTTELALAWATQPADQPIQWRERLKSVRGFARHLHSLDPATDVPPTRWFPPHTARAVPYLYSDADIGRLLQTARQLTPPLRAATAEALIGLLAVTGMRVSEALRLDRPDVRWEDGVLTVWRSKFEKSREVPLHPSALAALRAYAHCRDELCPRPLTASFFVSIRGGRLSYRTVHGTFSGLVRRAQIGPNLVHSRPRLHDLRHSFAVSTLCTWYRAGVDVQMRLPLLSTYLGHVDPKSTYWYLSAAPELLALAGERLEQVLGALP